MTLANKLTLLRLILVPIFVLFLSIPQLETRLLALLVFIVASLTDWYDGRLARRTGTVTRIGTLLDPLADKLLIAAALIGFVGIRELQVPAWIVVLVISREFLITGLRSLAAARGIVMAAEAAGKIKTASQIVAIISTLIILMFHSLVLRYPEFFITLPRALQETLVYAMYWAPYWLIMISMLITVFSGWVYIRRYYPMLREEFSI